MWYFRQLKFFMEEWNKKGKTTKKTGTDLVKASMVKQRSKYICENVDILYLSFRAVKIFALFLWYDEHLLKFMSTCQPIKKNHPFSREKIRLYLNNEYSGQTVLDWQFSLLLSLIDWKIGTEFCMWNKHESGL